MNKSPATKDTQGKAAAAPPRVRRLKTLDDVRRYLADVLHRLEAAQLDDAGAKTRAYIANTLCAIVKDADIEARIVALENAQQENRR